MNKIVTLIPGDGIGPEISESLKSIFAAAGVPVSFETENAGTDVYEKTGELIPESLYIRPWRNLTGVKTRFENVDIVIFRENTEGIYIGEEKYEDEGKTSAIAIKRITEKGCHRIIKSAFEYAKNNNLDKVTVVHKANILKLTDGLFLETARKISEGYPEITLEETIIDNMCMQLVSRPEKYKVIVTMNLYGDILSDLVAGLVGGLGIAPGANIGDDIAIFEAVHGSAPDIAGQNKANPLALILSGIEMLKYINLHEYAEKIEKAVLKTLEVSDVKTADLGGTATTTEFTDKIIENL